VEITADMLELRNGGAIASSTFASGDAGTVSVQADRLLISGVGAPLADSPLFTGIASAAAAHSTGAGGAVVIRAQNMLVKDRGAVLTGSDGTNIGGPITITIADTLQLDNALIQARTQLANCGDVTVAAGRLFSLRNSEVTTSVAGGRGSGGNITIDPPLMVLNQSRIEANAKQGAGGNITIRAGQLIRPPDSKITASGIVNGNIAIATPNTDISSSLVILPETLFNASSQLREACAARGGRPASSFAAGGRGGLPPNPGTPLAAGPFGQPLEQQTATGLPTALTPRPPPAAKPITVAGVPQPVLGSPRLTCRG
jgi:hypothetical protein